MALRGTKKVTSVLKPAVSTALKSAKSGEIEDDEMCVICHEAMYPSDLTVLECKHKFHLGVRNGIK